MFCGRHPPGAGRPTAGSLFPRPGRPLRRTNGAKCVLAVDVTGLAVGALVVPAYTAARLAHQRPNPAVTKLSSFKHIHRRVGYDATRMDGSRERRESMSF